MRLLITGGAGFLGSHLCERFVNDGHEVLAADNLITGSKENIRALLKRKKFRFIRRDVSEAFVVPQKLDAILHFASPASPPDYLKRPIETLKAGAMGTHRLLEIARQKKCAFLLASTSEVYGDPLVNPQKESYWGNVNPVGPRSVYDEAKRFAEALTMAYHRRHGVDTKIVRIFNTYGPRMNPEDGRVIPNFITQALAGKPLTLYGDGSQTRSYAYVDDLVEGITRLLFSKFHGPVNVGNPNEMTVKKLADLILEITGSKSKKVHRPLPVDDPKRRRPDIALAKKILNWTPAVPLKEGLAKTIFYFEKKIRG
ncbi:MAG: SDR family oxidoreductase [Candidatus Omnitrophica bacterium]|nr:SDR family oxidoreductase [Candidatus Omnitrophota bacterium]